jgi:uncharacterized protein YkwD
MRHRARRITVVVGLLLGALVLAACTPAAPPPMSPAVADMVERHNYLRGLNGLAGLAVDGGAQANAQFHADRLASRPGSCAQAPLWHSGELGSWYPGTTAGENVACVPGCPNDANQAFDMWLASPGHSANIFRPAFGAIGVGIACNGTVQFVVAQYHS